MASFNNNAYMDDDYEVSIVKNVVPKGAISITSTARMKTFVRYISNKKYTYLTKLISDYLAQFSRQQAFCFSKIDDKIRT